MKPLRICFITGTRADYGIQSRLMQTLNARPDVELQIIATNMHLSPAHGMTVNEIEQDGLTVSGRVECLLGSDSPTATVKSAGLAAIGIADALERLKPDKVVVLGDRYEMLAASMAAHIFRIPITHLYGGETTLGAYDDAIRYAITQLSSIHLTSTEQYRRRVIEMGKDASSVHCVGALGVDNIHNSPTLQLAELEKSIGHKLGEGFLLVTFHPATAVPGDEQRQIGELLEALENFVDERNILITLPNSDTGAETIREQIVGWSERHKDKCVAVASLGRVRYYTALRYCGAVVGNSSSGLIEAPSFRKPTVDIGDRQAGRAAGPTVIHSSACRATITDAIRKALDPQFISELELGSGNSSLNPYEQPRTLEKIIDILVKPI